jgi:hypothetical protein
LGCVLGSLHPNTNESNVPGDIGHWKNPQVWRHRNGFWSGLADASGAGIDDLTRTPGLQTDRLGGQIEGLLKVERARSRPSRMDCPFDLGRA